ncbi:hypothetical protein Salat_1409100 [Sesamum alatum]|uniref:Uncharacterized protein n=1 Tax=Sesamum alatum TaxID=300844 RepID=A0AAE1YA90_9LAMI|nr:hypothetical protein Salat_1409100 [Sesamum alatum]
MEKVCREERWALVNSAENSAPTSENGGGELEAEEDALSLCDLPLIHHSRKDKDEESSTVPLIRATETPEDFDFCCLLNEPEMCAADEVFFQGRILPFRRRLMSSGEGFLQYSGTRRSISRSESMDFHSSAGLISSRSSSTSSHQSSSSGSSAADPKSPPLNQFHSRPNPSPKTRFSTPRQKMVRNKNNNNRNRTKKSSSAWNIFRLGLLTPPEIAFQDLKTRCPGSTNRKNFGSRNSTSSNSSSTSSSSDKKKIIPRALLQLGGCKSYCSVDAVPTKVVTIKRSASDSEMEARVEEENLLAMKSPKKRMSHRRTFEWLKQLSLEGAAADEP